MAHFAINGFGRIGRTAFRVWWNRFRNDPNAQLLVINTSGSSEIEDWAHLLKYDSNYGVFAHDIQVERIRSKKEVTDEFPEIGKLHIEGKSILFTAQRDPQKIQWAKYGVHTVVESTGVFVTQEKASFHLVGGAQRVVLSAPSKGEGFETVVLGVNKTQLEQTGQLVSNASCTTNCIAPVSQVISEVFGVEKAMLTTIHAYTDDQNLHDNSHSDLRRARAAGKNIVPTSTGAAKALGLVLPEFTGIFDGLAIRVPVATGSLSDITFITKRETSVEEVNQAFITASQTDRWRGILAVTKDPIVSSDIIGRSESSIVDLGLTQVIGGNMVKVVSWYDNEWGYCNRLIEVVAA